MKLQEQTLGVYRQDTCLVEISGGNLDREMPCFSSFPQRLQETLARLHPTAATTLADQSALAAAASASVRNLDLRLDAIHCSRAFNPCRVVRF